MTTSNEYPLSAFYFKVVIGANQTGTDTSFQEVTGIGSKIDTESVVEGGENRYVHQLPKGVTHDPLTLKRGIAKINSELVKWCKSTLEGDFAKPVKPQMLHVYLLNEKGEAVSSWSFANAYPVKWEVESFNSTKNEVAIEKIELNYSYSNRIK